MLGSDVWARYLYRLFYIRRLFFALAMAAALQALELELELELL